MSAESEILLDKMGVDVSFDIGIVNAHDGVLHLTILSINLLH